MLPRRCILFTATVALALPWTARASWSHDATPNVRVHDHTFHRVKLDAEGCALSARLHFEAPEDAYADSRNAVRNHHRFRARVILRDGRSFETRIFGNDRPGERMYRERIDTEGCWAKSANKVVKLEVNACRGARCQVEPFG